MVAEPGREFQAGEMRYRFNSEKCVTEHSYQGNNWRVTLAMGSKETPVEVELNEQEAAKVEKPETVELGIGTVEHDQRLWSGQVFYGASYEFTRGKWRITATRVTE